MCLRLKLAGVPLNACYFSMAQNVDLPLSRFLGGRCIIKPYKAHTRCSRSVRMSPCLKPSVRLNRAKLAIQSCLGAVCLVLICYREATKKLSVKHLGHLTWITWHWALLEHCSSMLLQEGVSSLVQTLNWMQASIKETLWGKKEEPWRKKKKKIGSHQRLRSTVCWWRLIINVFLGWPRTDRIYERTRDPGGKLSWTGWLSGRRHITV